MNEGTKTNESLRQEGVGGGGRRGMTRPGWVLHVNGPRCSSGVFSFTGPGGRGHAEDVHSAVVPMGN